MLERVTLTRAGTTGSSIIYTTDETGFLDGDVVSVALDNGFLYRTRIANVGRVDTSVGVAPFFIDDVTARIDSHILRLTEALPFSASVGNFVLKDTSAGDIWSPEELAEARKLDAENRRALAARNAALKGQQRRLEKRIERFADRIEREEHLAIARAKARQAEAQREEARQRAEQIAEIRRDNQLVRYASSPEGRADRKRQFSALQNRGAQLAQSAKSAAPPPKPNALQSHFVKPPKKPSALEAHFAKPTRSKASVLGAHFPRRSDPLAALKAHFR